MCKNKQIFKNVYLDVHANTDEKTRKLYIKLVAVTNIFHCNLNILNAFGIHAIMVC